MPAYPPANHRADGPGHTPYLPGDGSAMADGSKLAACARHTAEPAEAA